MRKALAVGRKEFRQILRDRRTLLILLFVPAFFLLLYGYALNFDIRHVRLAVEDRDDTPESRAAHLGVRELRLLRPGRRLSTRDREVERPDRSRRRSRAALVIPAGLRPRSARRPQHVPVQVIINGDNANTAATVMGYALHDHRRRVAALSARQAVAIARGPPVIAWSRASGTTRSCAARCSSCPA